MDIHLDDRLLHGRIIHGWRERIGSRRCLLVSARLNDPDLCELYRQAAEDAGLSLFCATPEQAAAELESEDFILTDRPDCVARLLDAGLGFSELILIGLRDEAGEICGEDIVLAAETKDELRDLFRRPLRVTLRRFPGEPGRGLFQAEADGRD